jgi:N-acyl-D-aspartate/D-glutamate deacylase
MEDIIIRGGTIIDGSGAPSYRGDIAIRDGRITAIGMLKDRSAKQVIDADGLMVAPGFIDMHSHDDLHVLENKYMDAKIRQGVTTTVLGNCGFALYPVMPETKKLFYEYATGLFGTPEKGDLGYADLEQFFADIRRVGSAINVASLAAHGVLRIAVMGYDNRKPTEAEMARMKELLRQSMRSGAVGMSFGLIYAPGAYADTAELIELSKVVGEEGGFIASHMRSESGMLLDAIEEMITIAREARVPLEISHLKAVGTPNFGKGKEALRRIAAAKREGIDVTFDQYPYHAGSTTATTLLPPWALEGGIESMLRRLRDEETRRRIKADMINGIPNSPWENMADLIGWENIMVCSVQTAENKKYEGSNIKDIAEQLNMDPYDVFFRLLDEEDGRIILVMFQQDMNDMETIMTDDLQMFGSDGIPLRGKKAHPRLYGTYPRVLGTYVRERNLLTLERAVYKMTYLPAHRLGLLDRGLLRPGMMADITIFDMEQVNDLATYTNPEVYPSGIEAVLVNGVVVLRQGTFTGEFPGQPLRRTRV